MCRLQVAVFTLIATVLGGGATAEDNVCPSQNFHPVNEALLHAAANGAHREVAALLSEGADPNRRDATCHTAMLWAARAGHAAIFLELAEHSGDSALALPPPDGRNAADFVDRLPLADAIEMAATARANAAHREFLRLSELGEHRNAAALLDGGFLDVETPLDISGRPPIAVLIATRQNATGEDREAIFKVNDGHGSSDWQLAAHVALNSRDWPLLEYAIERVDDAFLGSTFVDRVVVGEF